MRFELGMKVVVMVVVVVGQLTARPHRQPFRGFGCDSVSLEGKAPLVRVEGLCRLQTAIIIALDLEERLNHTKCSETHGLRKPVIQHF